MAYVVWFNGEYDLDDFGNVITSHDVYEDYATACAYANSHTRDTGYVATVEEI